MLEPPADRLVHALKYEGWAGVAEVMAERMAALSLPAGPAGSSRLVVPVPTTPERERRRGYNQARVVAAAYAARTGRGLLDGLERPSAGTTQVSLQPLQRRANVARAFRIRAGFGFQITGERVVLVDDVVTTGATALAAAEVLARAGAVGVTVVSFARALPGWRRQIRGFASRSHSNNERR